MTDPTPPGPDDQPPRPEEPAAAAGPDASDAPSSEFLTPIHPYETVEPEAGTTWPVSGAPPSAPASPGRRRSGIGAAVVAVVLVAAGLAWVVSARSSSGPLRAPLDLIATADACGAPDCERLQATVTLSWSPVDERAEVVEILRAGRVMEILEPDVTTREIVGLRLDHSYVFGVRVVRGNDHGPASTVEVRTPTPPLQEAQLTGSFRVRERVRSARKVSSVEEIDNPRPGSSTVNDWSFTAVCSVDAGACPTRWFTRGPLHNDGRRYDGTFRGEPATCGDGTRTATTTQMHLEVLSARTIQGRWQVDRFRGTLRVTFACPGEGRSAALLQVDGRAGS